MLSEVNLSKKIDKNEYKLKIKPLKSLFSKLKKQSLKFFRELFRSIKFL